MTTCERDDYEAEVFKAEEPRRSRVTMESEPRLHSDGTVEVALSDGTELEIETRESGSRSGWPIMYAHGTPGSAIGPNPRAIQLSQMGIRLLTWTRPGYGRTTRHEGRIMADAATYTEAIAKAYGIERCSIAGRSGGGPAALAAAALLPELVVNAAVFSSIMPAEESPDWHAPMSASNRIAFDPAGDHAELARHFGDIALASSKDSNAVLNSIWTELSDADRDFLQDVMIRKLVAESHADGLQNGPAGRFDDVLAAQRPWGFDVRSIKVPVVLIHGGKDRFAPPEHFDWLVRHIPGVRADFYEEIGHIGMLDLVVRYFADLRSQAQKIVPAEKFPNIRHR